MAGNTTRMGTVLLLRYVAIHANNQTVIWFVNYQFCGLALDSNTIPYNLSRYLLTIFKERQGISRYLKIAMKKIAGFSFSCFPTAYHVGTPKDGFHMGSTNFVDQQNIYHHLQIFVDRQVKGDQLYSRSRWLFQEPKKMEVPAI